MASESSHAKPPSRAPRLFALKAPPPERMPIAGCAYRLERVFKHDFYAATCLYRAEGPARYPRVVVKFSRQQDLFGLPMGWLASLLADREQEVYAALAGLDGVPDWVVRISPDCYAIEYVDGRPLDHFTKPPPGFFAKLVKLMQAVHERGVAYGDANKRSNILVTDDGEPCLVDYQISIRRRDDWPRPLGALSRRLYEYLCRKDLYHLYKHKRRICPEELTAEEEALSRKRSGLHWLHRKLTKPYRSLRRRFLRQQHQSGRLVSPTASLEDHHQPEKATWRSPEASDDASDGPAQHGRG